MPIGFWAVSRADVKTCLPSYMQEYNKDPNSITEKDVSKFVRDIRDKLDDTLKDAYIDFAINK